MTSLKDSMGQIWPPEPPVRANLGAAPGHRPPRTPAEQRAEETTRVAREMTDAVADARHLKTARLREARLAAEAAAEEAARAAAALEPPKKARKRG